MFPSRHERIGWGAVTLVSVTMAAAVAGFATPSLLSAWRLAITLWAGLSLGSLLLVALGRLLDNDWRAAIEDELLPAAALLPVAVLLGLPLLLAPQEDPLALFGQAITAIQRLWFAADLRVLRLVGCCTAWGVALTLVLRSRRQGANALALALASLAALVALVDWVMLVPPLWWSRMLPFATMCSQLSAGLALAFVVHAASDANARPEAMRSLSSALLGMALVTIWVWFVQYLTAWSTNLPVEARWYRLRDGGFVLLAAAATLQLSAIVALILLGRRPAVTLLSSLAVLGAHGLHSLWFFRPAGLVPVSAIDLLALAVATLLFAGWMVPATRLSRRVRNATQAD